MLTYYDKYQKYKKKYLNLKLTKQMGGVLHFIHIYIEGISEKYHPKGITNWFSEIAKCETPMDPAEGVMLEFITRFLINGEDFEAHKRYGHRNPLGAIGDPFGQYSQIYPSKFKDYNDTPLNLKTKLLNRKAQGISNPFVNNKTFMESLDNMDMDRFNKDYAIKYYIANNGAVIIYFDCLNLPPLDKTAFEELKKQIKAAGIV